MDSTMIGKFLIHITILLLVFLTSCSQITMLSTGIKKDLYSDDFLAKVKIIKSQYQRGHATQALEQLKIINEANLLPIEKAFRRNLIGVMLFSKGNYEQAIFNFDQALTSSSEDQALTAQVYLNLSSSYYKLNFMDKAYATVILAEYKFLQKKESKIYHKLKFKLAKELGKNRSMLVSLFRYLSDKQKLNELKSEVYFEHLLVNFFKLSSRDKLAILEELEDEPSLCLAYIGYLEAEKLYYGGEKGDAKDILSWIEDKFNNYSEVKTLVQNFYFRVENSAKIETHSIGVILPLSGKKKNYGKRALLGIDSALRIINNSRDAQTRFNVIIKNSKGSGAVGAFRVKELVEKKHVSVIIGGLFSKEAAKEYLEAKKHGVFFISLSQIYLPKDQKDHLLFEIPGSVESQIEQIFSPEMLKVFGQKGAIIYPETDRGEAYVNEFWRKSKIQNVPVTGVLSYEKNKTDYRDPVKNLLGLKFPRERQEEVDLLKEIYALEKHRSTRRIQVLRPQVDFDWVFIPAFPKEALQIIPSFNYYDAFGLKIIGGPSWRSKAISKESRKLGSLYFVGDDIDASTEEFSKYFIEKYRKRPRMIEMMSYDSFNILDSVIANNNFSSREELDKHIRATRELTGITGKWSQKDGVWIKKLASLKIRNGKISNIFSTPSQP